MNSTGIFRQYSAIIIILTVVVISPQDTMGVEIVTYVDSAHADTATGVNRLSGYVTGNCAHCHEQHASIGGVEPTPPTAGGPSPTMLFDTLDDNAACTFCHDIAAGADNIASQMSKAYAHASTSSIYENALGAGNKLSCEKCHDSHYAQNTTHAEATDGNKIFTTGPTTIYSGALLSNLGVRAVPWTPGTPVAGAEDMGSATPPVTTVGDDHIDKEYELCFKCHAGQLDPAPATNLNIQMQFNPNHYAVHPVATELQQWKNVHLRNTPLAFQVASPWNNPANANQQMYCSDCHGSDNAGDPEGPHGSNNIYMLKAAGPGTSLDNLCTICHNPSASSAWVDTWGTAIVGDHTLVTHKHPANPLGCLACHGGLGGPLQSNIHGANYKWFDFAGPGTGNLSTAFLVGGSITQNYTLGGASFCAATCHTADGGTGYRYK